MNILLTGVSSFTGAWLAAALARAGHRVTGTLQGMVADYSALAQLRIAMIREAGADLCETVSYGNPAWFRLVDQGFDTIGYHGADVRDYRSPDFDAASALVSNTAGLQETCARAKRAGTARIVYTGSIAEPYEGAGDASDRAMSPYGLSKYLTWEMIRYYAAEAGLDAGKFVIPNPFGRFEQSRFCSYLVRCWAAGETAEVQTPGYVRDNIPVDRLSAAYVRYATQLGTNGPLTVCRPSGYVESQGDFTARFAREIGTRLSIDTPYVLHDQTEFPDPLVRINSDPAEPEWDDAHFWDDLAADYAERLLGRTMPPGQGAPS